MEIGGDEVAGSARGLDLADDGDTPFGVAAGDHDHRTLRRERDRDGASDPRRRTGDERDFPLHAHPRTLPAVESGYARVVH